MTLGEGCPADLLPGAIVSSLSLGVQMGLKALNEEGMVQVPCVAQAYPEPSH